MIHTTVNDSKKETQRLPYPKLMEAKDIGVIILAINEHTAVHLSGEKAGHYTDKWNMDASVVDLDNSITLKNQ
jgi:hypothetical protein